MAGNDAGHAYNDFPLMNGQWVPDEYFALPGWRNVFESTAAVQLHHRILALTTLASVGAVWWSQQGPEMARHLPRRPRLLLNGLLSVTTLQVCSSSCGSQISCKWLSFWRRCENDAGS